MDNLTIKEIEQQKEILKATEILLEQKKSEFEKTKKEIERLASKNLESTKEMKQKQEILSQIATIEKHKKQYLQKKYYVVIVIAGILIATITTTYSVYVVNVVGQQYRIKQTEQVRSNYVIQNLKGDTVDTWLSWRLAKGDSLHVSILDARKYPDKTEVIKNVILSMESIEIDDSLLHKGPKGQKSVYYLGWNGALDQSSKTQTVFNIPTLNVVESTSGEGDITIRLVTVKNADGYSGYTKSIVDDSQNQILKSEITIYDIENLSDDQLGMITRHEMGHAMGLAHSTAPEDLMHPIIQTEYPYISECVINAITALYDGSKKSEVVCDK